jgi:2-haloalkanoic acid dehalogenase type II
MSGGQGQHYRPFWEITRSALRYAALRLGLAMDAAAEERLMNQYHNLSSFPENREVLEALKARGIPAGILSNGDPPLLAVSVKSAGFDGLLDPLLSVDGVRRFKTDPAAYALGPQAMKLPPPGTATRRCGSTVPDCRWNSSTANPPAPTAACARCSTSFLRPPPKTP